MSRDEITINIGDHQMEEVNVDELIKVLKRHFSSSSVKRTLLDSQRIDFLLIGSRALRHYYTEQSYEINEFDESIFYKNHFIMKQIRKRLKNKSDWDFICFNIYSLIYFLEIKRNQIKNIRINYLVQINDFTKKNIILNANKVLNEDNETLLCLERMNEIIPTQWKEISLCLRLNDGAIIEIEYCNDNNRFINRYLDSIKEELQKSDEQLEQISVPFFTKCHIAPLELLELIKMSHLCQNIEKEKWKTHLIDLSFIRMLRNFKNIFVNSPFEIALDNQNILDFIYYDRLIKLIVLQTLLKSSKKSIVTTTSEFFEEITSCISSYIIYKSYPYNNVKDKLCNEILQSNVKLLKDVFKIKPINRRIMYGTDDVDYHPESLDYLAQQLCALILPRFNTWTDVDNLDEHLLFAFQKVCLAHHDNKILSFIVNNNLEISEKVNCILNQPLILTKFFKEQEIDFKLTHEEDENCQLLDISSLEGVNLCNNYLSSDIILKILNYISGKELHYMSILNKEWFSLFSNNNFWKFLCTSRINLSKDIIARINNWKVFTIIGYDKQMLPLPPNEELCKIVSVFKPHFANNPSEFNHFITNVFSNTFIIDQSTSFENYYDTLKANLIVHWPDNIMTKLKFSIVYDNDVYRGCSRGGDPSPDLTISLNDFVSNSLFKFNAHNKTKHFIGEHFSTELNGKMSICMLICLILVSIGPDWLPKVLK
ncbi:hypothetical protein ABK040_008965 [Willaertia magna]